MLGEVHDNPVHHQLRAGILAGHTWLVTSAEGDRTLPTPAVVFEHIRGDQRPALDHFKAIPPARGSWGNPGELVRVLDWDKSGWPDQKMFEPLFSAAIPARLPILPGDSPRDLIREAAKEGEAAVPPENAPA